MKDLSYVWVLREHRWHTSIIDITLFAQYDDAEEALYELLNELRDEYGVDACDVDIYKHIEDPRLIDVFAFDCFEITLEQHPIR